ncbi:MAG: type I pullulanase [Lachnospiraceae bacterium]|nr:type I pullulanase [Lachnospiraceae bacterium]
MEREKKFFRKKHRMANSVFSWLLAFAIVVSSVSTAPGFAMTSLAAENEVGGGKTVYTSESNDVGGSDAAGDAASGSDENDGAGDAASPDDGTAPADSSAGTGDSATPDESDGDDNGSDVGDNTPADDTGSAVDEPIADGAGDEAVTVKLHFKNTESWPEVRIYYWGGDTDTKGESWPGNEVKPDSEKSLCYTYILTMSDPESFKYIFNNNNHDKQTADLDLTNATGTYEAWVVWPEGGVNKGDEKVTFTEPADWNEGERIVSPEVNGKKVTFRYKNANAPDKVYVKGDMNGWDGDEMIKGDGGVYTLTMPLETGVYGYKFYYEDGDKKYWIQDPSTNKIKPGTENDSLVVVTGLYDAEVDVTKGEENGLPNELRFQTEDPDTVEYVAVTYATETEGVEIDGNKIKIPETYEGETLDLTATATVGGKTETATLTLKIVEEKLVSPEVNGNKVTFRYQSEDATAVSVEYGDGPSAKSAEMTKEEGSDVFSCEIELETGKHLYQFKVDDKTISDPKNIRTENGKSVVYVPGLVVTKFNVATNKKTVLPEQMVVLTEDGKENQVDVTYAISEDVDGVNLDAAGKVITVGDYKGAIEMTVTATDDEKKYTANITVNAVEDTNKITLNLHYHRTDDTYDDWNVWGWMTGAEGKQYDFTAGDDDQVLKLEFEDARAIAAFNYIIRKGDWTDREDFGNRLVDLSDILCGTVDFYVESGKAEGTRVLGDDVLTGAKITSAVYDTETTSTIKVTTGIQIAGSVDDVFALKASVNKSEETVKVNKVTADGNVYTLEADANLSTAEAQQKKWFVVFDGYEYKITMPDVYSSNAFEDEYTYTGDDLGATWSKEKTTFKVWAPTAEEVTVNLYKSGTKGTDDKIESIAMTKGEKGIWTAVKTGDLNGTYYTYVAVQDGESVEACDPYARTTGVNGDRAMVIDLDSTDPAGWANDSGPNQGMSYNDSVIYELHVRDFSIDESSGISANHKGKFLGLTETGTTNETGQPTGLDYLVDLGVTHIHLLPSYDYGSVDETRLDEEQYNWGYDPVNYNVPEGSYSTDPYNGEKRVKEMKQMIKTLHDNDINVIMDVVYNHVYNADEFCFNQLVPKYFSRTNADGSYSNASGCGNDTASERAMVRKYIVDSVNYWADEYHIDGFRFDLVGLLDTETINEVVETVHQKHPDAIFYGEGWTMDSAVSKPNITMAAQTNSAKTPNFAYFSDTIRDAIKGDNFDAKSTGFVTGATGLEANIAACFKAATSWCKSPTQTINYASCHDNYTLWDKISVSRSAALEEDRIRMNNLAAAIYMTAEGIPLIHAGEEILRTKPSLDPDEDNHGVEHNSYNLPDSVNSIKWSDLDKEEYRNVRDYYKGLIEFRKNHAALRLTSAADVAANVDYKWITNDVVMFVIGGKDTIAGEVSDGIVVIFNATDSEQAINLYNNYGVAEGTWNVCINDQKAGIKTLDSVTDGKVTVAPISAMVLVKGEAKDQESVYDKNELAIRKLQALKDLIAEYEKLEQGNYTDESWKTFTDALAAAKAIAEKSDVTVEEIDSAMDQLRAAYNGLEVPAGTVNKNELSGLVEQCRKLTEQGNYTYESWEKFTQARKKAEEVLAETDATQEEVNQAYEALKAAYEGLAEYTGPVDNSALKDLVNKYGKIEQGDYTDESWAAFQEALKEAERVVNDPDATQADIDRARAALEQAYEDLEEAQHGLWVKWADASMFTQDEDGAYHITYTGKAIKPAILVYDGTSQLKEKTDYTVAYKKNTNAGEAIITVTGKGNYAQSLQQSFFIDKVDIGTLEIADLYGVVAANNTKQVKPTPVVKYNGKALKLKTDYTVAYKNPETDGKTPDTYTVILESNANSTNFTGSKEIQMVLANKDEQVLMSKVTIKKIPARPYEWNETAGKGKVQEPDVVVTYKNNTLICKDDSKPEESWDYEVIYDTKHTEVGETATITVKGSGKKYVGEKTASFKITGTALKASKVSLKDVPKAGLVYTGAAQEPEVVVDGVDDTEENGYKKFAVEYQKNKDVGTATVVVTGINGYTGTVKKTFKITAYDIAKEDSLFTYGENNVITGQIPYAKGGSKLTDENVNARFTVNGAVKREQALEQGKDYTLSYKKNTAVGDASVSIKGKGNYKGTIKDIPFTIIPRDLSKLEDYAVAGDILEKNAKKYNTVIPVITDLNGKKLQNKTDFTVDKLTAYTYEDGSEIKGDPAVGSVIKVTAKAKEGNYTGEVSTTFRVIANDKNIAAAKVKVEPQIYTGAEVKLNYNDITVEMKENGKWVAIDKSNFEITGYSNNTKKGTAKVTIHGIGEYGGTKTVSFKINAKPMTSDTR